MNSPRLRLALSLFSIAVSLMLRPGLLAAPSASPAIPMPKLPAAPKITVSELPGGPHRFEDLFAPLRTGLATISPDGKFLAYPAREGQMMSVLIVPVDQPGTIKTKIEVLTDEDATPMLGDNSERTPAEIEWLRWSDSNRLVIQSNAQPGLFSNDHWYSLPGVISAFDADGAHKKMLVTPRDVALEQIENIQPVSQSVIPRPDEAPEEEPPSVTDNSGFDASSLPTPPVVASKARRPRAIDFVPGEPDSIYIRAEDTAGRGKLARSEIFKVNVRTGKMKSFVEEFDRSGYALLLDRQGRRAVTVPNTTQLSFPHVFTYDPVENMKGVAMRSLDAIAGFTGPGFSVSPDNYFGERAVPVGFDEDPSILYYASNVGRDTYGFYGLDLRTGKRIGLALENPGLDLFEPAPARFANPSPLVFDRYTRKLVGLRITDQLGTTRWIRPEMQVIQAACENTLPGRNVEIQEWDEAGRHFLLVARGPTDPGAYYLFDTKTNQLTEFIRRAPAMDAAKIYPTLSFAIQNADGSRLTGLVTSPRNARLKPVPVVVLLQPEPWLRISSDYNPTVSALAEMGVFVVQLNPRCAWGSGAQQRLLATQNGFEAGASADIVTALDWAQKHFEVSTKRVGIMGERRGAYLALRTLQLQPKRFRCAIVLEPTIDLAGWLAETRWNGAAAAPELTRAFFGSPEHMKETPLLKQPEAVGASVLLLSHRGPAGGSQTFDHGRVQQFAAAVRRTGATATVSELSDDYMARLPKAKAGVFREIEAFINENILSFRVDVGDIETKKD